MQSPPATRISHLQVPSAASSRLATSGGRISAMSASRSRNARPMSVIAAKSVAPRWWIHLRTCTARKRCSPMAAKKSPSWAAVRPSRSVLLTAPSRTEGAGCRGWRQPRWSAAVDFTDTEKVGNFPLRRRGRIGTMDGIGVDGLGKVSAYGTRRRFTGVGRPHQLAVAGDGILALQHLHHHRTGGHEGHQITEEGPLTVFGIEALRSFPGQADHAAGDHPQTGLLQPGRDLADGVLRHGIGFDDGQGALQGHERQLQWAEPSGMVPWARGQTGTKGRRFYSP